MKPCAGDFQECWNWAWASCTHVPGPFKIVFEGLKVSEGLISTWLVPRFFSSSRAAMRYASKASIPAKSSSLKVHSVLMPASMATNDCPGASSQPKPSHGMWALLAAGAALAVAAALVKISSVGFCPLAILWARAVVPSMMIGAVSMWYGYSLWGPLGARRLLLLHGVLGVGDVICYFLGIMALPIGDAVSLHSLKPVFVALLGWCILKERLQWQHWFATILCISGCLMVAQNHASHKGQLEANQTVGRLLVLISALSGAGNAVVTRHIMRHFDAKPEVAVWYFCIMDLAALSICTPFLHGGKLAHQPPRTTAWQVLALLGVAALSLLGNTLIILGFRHLKAAVGTIVVQTETVWAFLLQLLLYHTASLWSLGGACLISLGIIFVASADLRLPVRSETDGSLRDNSHAFLPERGSHSSHS